MMLFDVQAIILYAISFSLERIAEAYGAARAAFFLYGGGQKNSA